MTQAYWIN